MKKLFVEFIGTFLFLVVVGTAVAFAGNLAPVAIGSLLMIMVYAGGHISGGHYNPAVTLGILVRGRIKVNEAVQYWIVQLIAAALGALVANYLTGCCGSGASAITGGAVSHSIGQALVGEFLGTFALVYVVLNVATSKLTAGNSYYGLAIGFTVVTMAFALGSISGGAFNPAIAFGQTVGGHFAWADLWVYLVACFLGGAVAGVVFNFLNPDDK